MEYIAFDIETGGLTDNTSLLTAYFAVYDSEFNKLDELDLQIKPPVTNRELPVYCVTSEALTINKINLVEHGLNAISFDDAKTQLYDFLKKHSDDGKDKMTPLGHGVAFDVQGITKRGLIRKSTWNHFCSYRVEDTSQVGKFLQKCGVLPPDVTGSLESFSEYFNISGDLHTAKFDTELTVAVYQRFLGMVRKLR